MDTDLQTELTTIQDLIEESTLTGTPRQTAISSLKKMPLLYQEMMRTYESRFADEILRLIKHLRQSLTECGAVDVAETIVVRVTAFHARRGFPDLGLKPALPAPIRRTKKKGG